jgi:general secretion pathway protein A
MDHVAYFDLAEDPFSYIKPNPRFFYNASQYLIAKTILTEGIKSKSAHLYLTGPIGTGKTTLLRVINFDFESDEGNIVFLTYAPKYLRSPHSFLKRLCSEMGIKTARSYNDMLANFEEQIGVWAREGRTPILLVDEAHKLTAPAFDFFHHIMNFVTDERLLIVLILAGQEELVTKLRKRPELRSRMQAVSLSSLTVGDAKELIRWRWKIASGDRENSLPFDEEAMEEIHRVAKGLPRDMCSIADRSLQMACMMEMRSISREMIREIAKSLNFVV